ncbi:palmitoyltransferase ZDHHC23-B isoform X2 [Triplophysa rosa]|uniref:palmitoyltransferase ZDHHC23-B isoform X2 n=1 Tax=Triplophysa rosa TaxID=992332 RepID=UPI002545C639|nr:palmitoyltransferase ZDHHC23-B isoform X2 [Triplophysa rosa]
MKKRSHQALDQEDPLCCCEYVDRHGRRSHVAACCCDCEDLDDAFDSWMKKEPQKADSLTQVVATINDRLRVPWISVILYYYLTHRKKGRTLFFLSLAVFSLFYMFYLFIAEVVPRGDVNHIQLGAVTTGVALTVISLINTKRGPGYVRPHPTETHSTVTYHNPQSDIDAAYLNGARHQVVIANRVSSPDQTGESGTASVEPREGQKRNWCSVCKVVRPSRAGHCRICGVCILRLDHHCVWINSCVGQANHISFLLTLVLFVLTSLYGISLVLRSVCPQQSVMMALFYCPDVYNQHSTALCFTCAWYSSIVTGGLLHLLVLQLINVSYNTTQREVRLALREKTGRTLLWGLIVDTGVYCRGFRSNWVEFLTMSNALEPPNPKPTDLV